jgi:hypothetical protein
MGPRELALCIEYNQQYYEILLELEQTATITQQGRALEELS